MRIQYLILLSAAILFSCSFYIFSGYNIIQENKISQSTNKTFSQWNQYIANTEIGYCDQLPEFRRNTCYSTSQNVQNFIQPSTTDSPQPCKDFWNFYEKANGDDLVNQDGYYTQCFTMNPVMEAALGDPFYYYTIYAPVYLVCAGIEQN